MKSIKIIKRELVKAGYTDLANELVIARSNKLMNDIGDAIKIMYSLKTNLEDEDTNISNKDKMFYDKALFTSIENLKDLLRTVV